jgi:hypothetical protein
VLDGVTKKWLHIGTDETYIAFEQISSGEEGTLRPYRDVGINHVGFVVEDVETIVSTSEKSGL